MDTVCSARKVIRIAGDDYPAEVVKSRFMKLDSSHVQYVMDCMKDNTTYVRNIKKYLLAADVYKRQNTPFAMSSARMAAFLASISAFFLPLILSSYRFCAPLALRFK